MSDEEKITEPYYCPASGDVEDPTRGGFDVCCDKPDEHISVAQAIAEGWHNPAAEELPYGGTPRELRLGIVRLAQRGQEVFEETLRLTERFSDDEKKLNLMAHGASFHGWALASVLGWIGEKFGAAAEFEAAAMVQDIGNNGGAEWCEDLLPDLTPASPSTSEDKGMITEPKKLAQILTELQTYLSGECTDPIGYLETLEIELQAAITRIDTEELEMAVDCLRRRRFPRGQEGGAREVSAEEIVDRLARARGYLSRVETLAREDRERLVFACEQIDAALTSLLQGSPSEKRAGWDEAVAVVRAALEKAKAEPRGLGPTERNGRITALGVLLQQLESASPTSEDGQR